LSIGGSASLPSQVALLLSDTWQESSSEMSQQRNIGVFYAAVRPQGSGRVITLPLLRDPMVTYHLTRSDLMLLGKGLEHLTHLALAAGANRVWASMRGAPCATSPDQANLLARNISRSNISLMSVHLFSSVPMGEHSSCPADSFGRLKAESCITINDASLLPTAPGVNPQGTIMAIAHRNAVRWAQEWSPHRAN
jgi:choline dehydrogenase-like flavoprotein